ncbi:MAG: acyltransferase family protein, partial [Nocardioidaceae bacterium]
TIDVGGALRDLGVALLYLANWNVISGGMEAPLPHLWSLAVEEQFYLVWPATLLALLLLGRRARLVVVGVLLAVSATLPWLYWDGGAGQDRVYFGTDTRAVGLLAGAFCALVWHERHARGRSARFAAPRALAGLAFVVVICLQMGTSEWKFTLLPALLGLAVSQLVPYLVDSTGPVSRAFTARWLVWAGKRSYGIYLWQYVWATWTHPLGLWPGMPLGVLGTLVSTELSWALVEAPVLRWSRRFRPGTAPVRTPRTSPVLVLDPAHAAAVAAHRTLRAPATS